MIQQFHFCIYTGKNRSQGREQILVLYSQHHYSQQPNEGDGPLSIRGGRETCLTCTWYVIYKETLFSLKKKGNPDTAYNTDEPWRPYAVSLTAPSTE